MNRPAGGMRTLLAALGAVVVGCAGYAEGLAETEEKADVRSTRPFVRERFQFEYPGNWTIDEADEDYDPDHLFSIDSPGSCTLSVIVFDAAISAKTSLDGQVEAFVPRIVNQPVQTPFTRWGAYDGEGVALAGKILGVMPGNIRIFAHESQREALTFTIVEFCFDEDLPLVRPGFELIERTFALERGPH
jgi:hypothetical protein